MTSGYYLDRGYHSKVKVWGSKGWLDYTEWLQSRVDPCLKYCLFEKDPGIQAYSHDITDLGYSPFVRAAVRSCAGLEAPPLTTSDSLRVLKTVFAFYKAAETGVAQRV